MYQVNPLGHISQEIALIIAVVKALQLFTDQIENNDILDLGIVVDAEMSQYGIGKDLDLYFLGGKWRLSKALLSLGKA